MAIVAHPFHRRLRRRSLRGLGFALLALAVLLGAGCAALVTQERELTFRPTREASGWFSGLPADVREFYLPVSDAPGAERLHAWYWPSDDPRAPTLLYLHGVRWNLTAHLRRIENLRSFGFTVMAIDYRGFGRSDGDLPSEESVYEDAHAAWRWVVERESDAAKRFVYGHSLGTAVATHLASDEGGRDGLGGLILEGAFTNLPEMAAALAPSWLPIDRLVTQRFDTRSKIARTVGSCAMRSGWSSPSETAEPQATPVQ
jgi:pimeloyl-ACP methyl ester carboxylesterase